MVCGRGLVGKGLVKNGFQEMQTGLDKIFGREIEYSIAQKKKVYEYFIEMRPEVIVNAAGPSNVFESLSNPDEFKEFPWRQCAAQLSVLNELPSPPIYIFISSGSVYGETKIDGATEETLPNPISPYAEGKLRAEQFLRQQSDWYRGRIVVIRCFSIYSDDLQSRLPFIIASNMKTGKSFTLSGTGHEVRDFVHVDDVAIAIKLVCANEHKFSLFNIGTGNGVTVQEVCRIAASAFGVTYIQDQTVCFNGYIRESDPKILVADVSKIGSIGFSPSIHPREGLLRFFELKRQGL